MANALLTVLDSRNVPVPLKTEIRIRSCIDRGKLDKWLCRSMYVSSVDELFDDALD